MSAEKEDPTSSTSLSSSPLGESSPTTKATVASQEEGRSGSGVAVEILDDQQSKQIRRELFLSKTPQENLSDSIGLLRDFNEKSDIALETVQPLMQQYVQILKVLRSQVVSVTQRAAKCVERSKKLAEREKVDIAHLQLAQHDQELEREEKAELK